MAYIDETFETCISIRISNVGWYNGRSIVEGKFDSKDRQGNSTEAEKLTRCDNAIRDR